MTAETDAVLTHLGTGLWSYLYFFTVSYSCFLLVPHTLGAAFLAPHVSATCRDPSQDPLHPYQHSATATIIPATNTNTTNTTPATTTLPVTFSTADNASASDDQCLYRVGGEGEERWRACVEWDYDNSTFTSTITSEFQLTCGREYLRTTYQSIFMFGVFVGAPVNGFLSDRYGRKKILTLGTWLYLVVALVSAWLPFLSAILVARFLLGTLHAVVCYTGYIIAVEITEPRLRTTIGFAIYISWAGATVTWGVLAYLVRSWRLLHLLATLPGLLILPALWFLDESPRWLVVRGRHEEAVKVLTRAARWHKVTLPPHHELQALAKKPAEQQEVEGRGRSLGATLRRTLDSGLVLFRTSRLRSITLLLYLNYFIATMVYFGLSLSGGSLSDDPFVYIVLSGLMELPAYTLIIPMVQRLGRRIPGFSCFFFCGVALVALAFIPTEYNTVVVTLAMLGKVSITGAFQTVVFFSSELFPTEVRSRGIGTSYMMSRIGAVISPFITDFVGSTYAWAPSVVFGGASLVAAAATLGLPETLGTALPDTITDLETRQMNRQSCLPFGASKDKSRKKVNVDAEPA